MRAAFAGRCTSTAGEGPKILLEGRPAVGKTTVARRLAELLRGAGVRVRGFVTGEIRVSGCRVGFEIETFEGGRATLAHVDRPGRPRVSRYGVDVAAFERLALPALRDIGGDEVVVVDELGKMELFSAAFREAVSELFDGPAAVVATVHIARQPFTDALKQRSDTETVQVTRGNRDELPVRLAARLRATA